VAKRFTDTDKWKDEWFLELEPTLKVLWIYILDTCDHAGIWKANFKLASYSVGTILDKQSAIKAFKSRVKVITDDKWHVTKFISYQYKGKLNPEKNNAHRGVVNALILNGIDTSPYLAPSEPLVSQPTLVTSPTGLGIGLGLGEGSSFFSSSKKEEPKKILSMVQNEGNLKTDQLIQLFNDRLASKKGFPFCRGLSGNQINELITTLSFPEFQKIETWEELFEKVSDSEYLAGKTKRSDFVATLGWLVKHDNALNVLNGQYGSKTVLNGNHGALTPEEIEFARKEGII
jgi:hypothetical protein